MGKRTVPIILVR